jgi:ETC complex I subunit conserved region
MVTAYSSQPFTTTFATLYSPFFGSITEALRERTVRIYRPARTATQSGKQGAKLWKIDFDILPDGARWENSLIGWASSSDYQQALTMKFAEKDQAISFAEKQGKFRNFFFSASNGWMAL